MKRLVTALYTGLYIAIAGSLLIVEIASIKVGWLWISRLVEPMGILFLVVNVPLALLAVGKTIHVVFLHSVKHHKNVMRSIREMDALPYPNNAYSIENEDDTKQVSHGSGTSGTLLSGVSVSQGVSHETHTKSDNVVVAYYLADHPQASIRDIEKATKIPRASIGRTNAWKNRGR